MGIEILAGILGFVSAIAFTVSIVLNNKKKHGGMTEGQYFISEAIKDGRVVTGVRDKARYMYDTDYHRDEYRVRYVYKINGKSYHKWIYYNHSNYPNSIELYYAKNKPDKAIENPTEYKMGKWFILTGLLPIIIGIIVYWGVIILIAKLIAD